MANLILVGDRVLIDPNIEGEQQTDSGILLPASVADKDRIRQGRVVNVGPGYLMANPEYSDQPWRRPDEAVRYLPLQAMAGDLAFFLRKEAIEFNYQGRSHVIVPHGAILVLVRPGAEDVLEHLDNLLES